MQKICLITGTPGQDGSYLSELLLEKGYKVYGIQRRTSTITTERIDHLLEPGRIETFYADLTDPTSLIRVIDLVKPDEIYNLASQSHVRVSFDKPVYTADVTALGPLRLLEIIRLEGYRCKFYQASSSEMWGITPAPQNEQSMFQPQSPYGISKLFAYWATKAYRTGYGMFACNGILTNHESILPNSPIVIKDEKGIIDIVPIEDMFKSLSHRAEGLLDKYKGIKVWNGNDWVIILGGSSYYQKNKYARIIQSIGSVIEATHEHVVFTEEGEKEVRDIKIGDHLVSTKMPINTLKFNPDLDLAFFLGYVVGDGYISNSGRIRLTGTDKGELEEIAIKFCRKYGWDYRIKTYGNGKFKNCKKLIWQLDINNDVDFGKWLWKNIYTTRSREKRVPIFILNGTDEAKKAFWEGYYKADGRQHGGESYQWKGFTTKSATLCLGLISIFESLSKQLPKVKCDYRKYKSRYYYCVFRTGEKTNKGSYNKKHIGEVVKILDTVNKSGWFYDLQTSDGTFATGPKLCKIHNSPRRGRTFVTQKIVYGAVRIKLGKQNELRLGNLDALRDWGHSKDFVRAMYMIMQHSVPDDFVVATGYQHSVREFAERVFKQLGLDFNKYCKFDNQFLRPNEVPSLCGDSTKIRTILGWKPEITFDELIADMIEGAMKHEMP